MQTGVGNRKEANRNNAEVRDWVPRLPFLHCVLELPGTAQKVRGSSASLPDPSMKRRESGNLSAQTGTVLSNYSSRNMATKEFLGRRGRCLMISGDFCATSVLQVAVNHVFLALPPQPLVPKI